MARKSFRDYYESNEWKDEDDHKRDKEEKMKARKDQRKQKQRDWFKEDDEKT